MLTDTLLLIFKRDLEKLKSEIQLYQDEGNMWLVSESISNSAGNLCLHLVGNLNAYIGTEIGETGYIRHRDREFSDKDVPRGELVRKIEETILMVTIVLNEFPETKLQELFPKPIFGFPMTYEYFLTHLAVHLGYHLGQVNYHRRLLDK
jgi:hypothetical protein